MDLSDIEGLSLGDVEQRRRQFGYNELPDRENKSILKIILGIVTEPMILVLIAVVVVYFLLGDPMESIILMVSVAGIISINLFQDLKTEKTLEALRSLASPSCEVIRGGRHMTIPSRELVPGDMMVVNEGSRVPADGRLVLARNLSADESLLTGESMAVEKALIAGKELVFSGAIVVKGHGVAEVTAIGLHTEMGKIGDSLNKIEPEETLLNKEIDRVVKHIAIGAISAALLLTLVFWLTRGSLLNGFLAGLTLSIAILPEEFPVVLTVFMALGAWRMAKKNVLTRKSSAIETLGATSVLCTDKTGTLTENRMTIAEVMDSTGELLTSNDKRYHHIVSYGVLASQINPYDPMEEAFVVKTKEILGSLKGVYNGFDIVKEYPLEEGSLSVVHVWGGDDDKAVTVALKGAPEAVAELCKLTESETKSLYERVSEFAKQGYRVLAVAEGASQDVMPDKRENVSYKFLGLVALADPVRREAASAVKLCREAGIRVVMITGDYPETARRIGIEVGLDSERVVTGEEFETMSSAEQGEAIKTISIFSRVAPSHKLMIVDALKRNGEVVAMTGDGVNDAPALKAAHIGIAMGKRGTDVAREAASIVLLDDNFASIVQGVRLGRRIFDNLMKAMAYILTVHIPIIVMSLIPVLMGWPLVLLPIHIVFLEFIIDSSCTLIFESEPEAPGSMKRPPRRLDAPLFSRQLVMGSLVEGLVMSLVVFIVHFSTVQAGWHEDKSRALTFLIIALMNLALIFVLSGRSAVKDAIAKRGKSPMMVIIPIMTVALAIIYFVPAVTGLFKFESLNSVEIGLAFTLSTVCALLLVPIRKIIKK